MTTTKVVSRTGETPDEKSKRMAKEVPARILSTREASAAVYDVVKPASEQRPPQRRAKAPKA